MVRSASTRASGHLLFDPAYRRVRRRRTMARAQRLTAATSQPVWAGAPATTQPQPGAGGAGGVGGATGTWDPALPEVAGAADGSALGSALGSGAAEPLAEGSGAALPSGDAEPWVCTMEAWQRFDLTHWPVAQLPSGQVPVTTSASPRPSGRMVTHRAVSMHFIPPRHFELSQRAAAMQKVAVADSEVQKVPWGQALAGGGSQ